MFNSHKQPATCVHYNATAEKRGKNDFVPAGDLKLKMIVPNTVLDEFGPDYRTFLYSKANARAVTRDKDAPDQAELIPAPEDGLTALAHPMLEPLRLREKFTGYYLSIATELGLSEPLIFDDVTLSGFVFKALDGGSLELTFHARVLEMSPEDSGSMHFLSRQSVLLTLEPPGAAPQQADIEDPDQAGGDTLDHQDAAAAA
ncbi:hypothetical protein [Lysobacter sp. ESA13C]|uniref:hypothetical protein n=1 Tax=Lysobacter sp. ESA13C TaxID=2862676 RepID=UPI001CBB29FD|nr:hypothetical protein [Lysobacter sp. ESA13C]